MKRVCKKFPRLSPPHSPAKPSKQPKKGALARLAEPCGPSDSPFKPERSRRGRATPLPLDRARRPPGGHVETGPRRHGKPLPSARSTGVRQIVAFPISRANRQLGVPPLSPHPTTAAPFPKPPALPCGPHTRKAVPSTREAGRPSRTAPVGRHCPSPFKDSLLSSLAGRPSSTRCSAGKTPFLHCFLW